MLAFKVYINGSEMNYLIDSGAMHNYICNELLNTTTLQKSRDEPLEVLLVNGEKVINERVC